MELNNTWDTISESLLSQETTSPRSSHVLDCEQVSWQAVFSNLQRPILVPSGHAAAQRHSLDFFLSNPWRRLCAKGLLHANNWLPSINLLPELRLPAQDGSTLLDELSLSDSSQIAFQIGTPGPYQKASLLIMSSEGTPHALVKIALKQSADEMIVAEASWLARLSNYSALAGKLPMLLGRGRTSNGRQFIALSVAPSSYTADSSFSAAHAALLSDLSQIQRVVVHFGHSPVFHYLRNALEQLEAHMKKQMFRALTDALDDCTQRLAEGMFVVAHGDFASWNVRSHNERIFVFDWEYAREGASPLHDIYHFFLAPHGVSRRGVPLRELQAILRKVQGHAQCIHPNQDWHAEAIAAHALVYLIYTVLYYSLSHGQVIEDDPVIRSYYQLIRTRTRWM